MLVFKVILKEIESEPYSWVLYSHHTDYVLEVICGSVAIYEVPVLLNNTEKLDYENNGRRIIEKLSQKISNSIEFQNSRKIELI